MGPTALSLSEFIVTLRASASTLRGSIKRGGANGTCICLILIKDWRVNNPVQLTKVLSVLEGIQKEFTATQTGGKKISIADLIVLAGTAAVETVAKDT